MSKTSIKEGDRVKLSNRRTLAAIMFTDIVGYTALNQSDEERALEVLEKHNDLLRPFFPKFHGREVKTVGDSFLVEFRSALDATRCAIEIQEFLHEYNFSTKEDWKIKVRIGIHVGDVVHKGKDILGDAVNIASRIEPLADPEGVCISEQVYDQVHNKIRCLVRQLEHSDLRNIDFQTKVYSLEMPWRQRERIVTQQEQRLPEPERMRVAVLPFSNLSPDPNDGYFADGMTEEVISTISKIQGLDVISRTSVMQYKQAPKPIREVSKELDVGTVLEGSVRKAGNRLRISTQMIDATRDRHLWAESYDRELQDVFAIQRDIASKVADALQARISEASSKRTENLEAYTIYLRAMQLSHEGTDSSLNQAISLFEEAIEKDKTFARAYVGLAFAWDSVANSGYQDFAVAIKKVELAARKAVHLDPYLADAHAAMAIAYSFLDRGDESISEAEKAVELNPNLSDAHLLLGINLALDSPEESLAEFQKAHELDPLSYRAGEVLANVYMILHRNSEALMVLEKLKDLNPRYAKIYVKLADYYMETKEFHRAQEMLNFCFRIDPRDPEGRIDQGVLYAYTGRIVEAESILKEIMENETESVRLWGQFWLQNALGNFDEVFRALKRMGETHDWPVLIKHMPDFKELRKDPRFAEFCSSVGISPPT